jgi:hypothetical protein
MNLAKRQIEIPTVRMDMAVRTSPVRRAQEMNTSHRVQAKTLRRETPNLEQLDARIVPSTMNPGAVAAAEMGAKASVQAGEAVPNTVLGVLRREIRLEKLIERRELRLARLEAREARLQARHHRAAASLDGAISSAGPTPATWGSTGRSTPAVSTASPVSAITTSSAASIFPTGNPTLNPNPVTPVNTTGPLPINVASALDAIYDEYENGTLPATSNGLGQIQIQGNDVGIMVRVNDPADFASDLAGAASLGMQVNANVPSSDTFAGFLPIAELPAVAQLSDAPIIVPVYVPMLS